MKIGCLYTAFNCKDCIKDSLLPWIEAKKVKLNGNEFLISAVSVPFEEYKDITSEDDGTVDILDEYLKRSEIDNLIKEPKFIKEHIARDNALQYLLKQNIDSFIIIDGDEFYSLDQISSIFDYVNFYNFVQWFSISYKNFVFDKNTYLVEPFTPPRIFMNGRNGHNIVGFYYDNDIFYGHKNSNISYKSFINITIPKEVAWINHYSWLSNDSNRKKYEYQLKHFGFCSYKWDYENNKLVFDEDYFAKIGKSIPQIAYTKNKE